MAVRDNKKPARWRAEIVLSLLIMAWICRNATDFFCLLVFSAPFGERQYLMERPVFWIKESR